MNRLMPPFKTFFLITFVFCCYFSAAAQNPVSSPTPVSNEEDILRVDTNLIQTGVTVVNKKGDFVNDLKQEDFEVRVDGKPITTTYFDKIIERKQNNQFPSKVTAAIVERGRTLIFLVDDVHLGIESNIRTRKLITKFIETEMLDDDLVAIIGSSGRIGFLQQFTSDKTVLRAALERIKFNRNFSANNDDPPPMSENEALEIDRLDRDTISRFIRATIAASADPQNMSPQAAASIVNFRARTILDFARTVSKNTFSLLEETMNKTRALPGRKALFFISDGFLLDPGNTDATYRLNKITNAAARSNTVIYSFDARGLDAGESRGAAIDMQSSSFMTSGLSRFESQDGLSYLADKTGGKFIRNTNDLQTNLTKVAAEAFTYYLIAWEPETDDGKSEKLKNIEISIKGRPELKVRVNSGYLSETPKNAAQTPPKQLTAEQNLIASTNSLIPRSDIPIALAANYLNTNDGGTLTANIQIDSDFIEWTKTGAAASAELEIFGLIYNSDGKRDKTFKIPLKLNTETARLNKSGNPPFYYEYQTNLKPDLYQIRIAVRDIKSGRIGNTSQWLEIADLSSRKLQMSSLLIGERKNNETIEKTANSKTNQAKLQINVDRRFENSSSLRFFGFIYNTLDKKEKSTAANLKIQAQILQQGKILSTEQVKIFESEEKEPTQLIYGGEIPLKDLPPGRYELKVTVSNPSAKTNAEKSVNFLVK